MRNHVAWVITVEEVHRPSGAVVTHASIVNGGKSSLEFVRSRSKRIADGGIKAQWVERVGGVWRVAFVKVIIVPVGVLGELKQGGAANKAVKTEAVKTREVVGDNVVDPWDVSYHEVKVLESKAPADDFGH